MKAYIFPGQGSQDVGMGERLCAISDTAREFLEMADDILEFKLSDYMFHGTKEELRETRITQPAVFVYSVIKARVSPREFKPDMVTGHSLGELSALASIRCFSYAEGLRLVQKRAEMMQQLCIDVPSGMAAVMGLDDAVIESICSNIEETVVAANYNCPGQLVISGTEEGLAVASKQLKAAGARAVLRLTNVHGGFHSPVMEPARIELAKAIEKTQFKAPLVPIYQNFTARPSMDPQEIKDNLIQHLTSPVYWTQTIENMVIDGAKQFIEIGAKPVLGSMIKRINNRFTPVFL